MAYSTQTTTVTDASDLTYSCTLDFVKASHITVYQNGVQVTDFTISGNSGAATITLGGTVTLLVGDILLFKRVTPAGFSDRIVDWTNGSAIDAGSLDTAHCQNLAIAQETKDQADTALTEDVNGDLDVAGRRLTNLPAPAVGSDAARLADVQALALGSGNLPVYAGLETDFLVATVADGNWAVKNASDTRAALGLGTAALANTGGGHPGAVPTRADADARYNLKGLNLSDVGNAATARTNLGLGSAATKNVGVAAGEVPVLDGAAALPAVSGANLVLTGHRVYGRNGGHLDVIGTIPLTAAQVLPNDSAGISGANWYNSAANRLTLGSLTALNNGSTDIAVASNIVTIKQGTWVIELQLLLENIDTSAAYGVVYEIGGLGTHVDGLYTAQNVNTSGNTNIERITFRRVALLTVAAASTTFDVRAATNAASGSRVRVIEGQLVLRKIGD